MYVYVCIYIYMDVLKMALNVSISGISVESLPRVLFAICKLANNT